MTFAKFIEAFKLENQVLGITKASGKEASRGKEVFSARCTMTALKYALKGNELVLNAKNSPCGGGLIGMGFVDGLPQTPGGFGKFISYGAGEGFPEGERLKSCPETGERMILSQPQNVLSGFDSIIIKPYAENDNPDTVCIFCNTDQLAALNFLFNYSKSGKDYDTVIMPPLSGCASIFRIPFAEAEKEEARAVVGLSDFNAKLHFNKDWLTFTVSHKDFQRMLNDLEDSFIQTKYWKTFTERL